MVSEVRALELHCLQGIIKGPFEVSAGHADDLRSTSSNVNVGERPKLGCQ